MPVRSSLFALVLLASTTLAAEPLSVEVRLVNEKVAKGDLISLSATEVVLKGADGETKLPIPQVLEIAVPGRTSAPPPNTDFANVELVDGSLFRCQKVTFEKGGTVHLLLFSGQDVPVELAKIKYILRGAKNADLVKEWREQAVLRKTSFDVIGVISEGRLNPIECTFGALDAKAEKIDVTLSAGKATRALPVDKIQGMLFARGALVNAAPILCKFHDRDGDLLLVSAVARKDDGGFTLTTTAGAKVQVADEAVVLFDYNKGKLTYLSAMAPATKPVYKSRDGSLEEFRADKNLDNQPILIDGRPFAHGLAIHSHTELEYNLGGDYLEFKTTIGFDDNVGGHPGPVLVRILGDNRELLAMTFDRARSRKAQDVVVNVKDVQRLKIIVASGDRHDLGRSIDLGDARVSK